MQPPDAKFTSVWVKAKTLVRSIPAETAKKLFTQGWILAGMEKKKNNTWIQTWLHCPNLDSFLDFSVSS